MLKSISAGLVMAAVVLLVPYRVTTSQTAGASSSVGTSSVVESVACASGWTYPEKVDA